jgi:hypothetical protein
MSATGQFLLSLDTCVRMRVPGVRDEMWPVSCGSAAAGTSMSSSESVLRVQRIGHAYALH